jgi:hypothetical protein
MHAQERLTAAAAATAMRRRPGPAAGQPPQHLLPLRRVRSLRLFHRRCADLQPISHKVLMKPTSGLTEIPLHSRCILAWDLGL